MRTSHKQSPKQMLHDFDKRQYHMIGHLLPNGMPHPDFILQDQQKPLLARF